MEERPLYCALLRDQKKLKDIENTPPDIMTSLFSSVVALMFVILETLIIVLMIAKFISEIGLLVTEESLCGPTNRSVRFMEFRRTPGGGTGF